VKTITCPCGAATDACRDRPQVLGMRRIELACAMRERFSTAWCGIITELT